MKQLKVIITATVLLAAFTSCKKDHITVSEPVQGNTGSKTVKLAKVETADGSYTEHYTYNADGRLSGWNNGYFTVAYSYAATAFGYELFASNNTQKQYDIADVIMNNGRVDHFLYRRINADGTLAGADTVNQQYDANGYQVQKSYGTYKYTAEITGGNTTKQTAMNLHTGKVNYEVTAEYYTDKPNKTNINIFEYNQFDHVLSDKEQFGKRSTNLPKKIIRASTNTYVYEYTYQFNENGYITSYTISTSKNNGEPTSTTYKLSYL